MGQSRYGPLPRTRNWRKVVEYLGGAPAISVPTVASATLRAARPRISALRRQPVFSHCIWLLVQLPKTSRKGQLEEFITRLGLAPGACNSPAALLMGLSRYLHEYAFRHPHNSALSEIVPLAFKEALTRMTVQPTINLFGQSSQELQSSLRRYSEGSGFGDTASLFFGTFLQRTLSYFLSKEIANHVGPANALDDTTLCSRFEDELGQYCRERAAIITEFATDWHGKHSWRDEDSEQEVQRFAAVCLRKVVSELGVDESKPE